LNYTSKLHIATIFIFLFIYFFLHHKFWENVCLDTRFVKHYEYNFLLSRFFTYLLFHINNISELHVFYRTDFGYLHFFTIKNIRIIHTTVFLSHFVTFLIHLNKLLMLWYIHAIDYLQFSAVSYIIMLIKNIYYTGSLLNSLSPKNI